MRVANRQESMTLLDNKYWTVVKHGPRNYTAKRQATKGCPEQVRFYFSIDALERDLGRVIKKS